MAGPWVAASKTRVKEDMESMAEDHYERRRDFRTAALSRVAEARTGKCRRSASASDLISSSQAHVVAHELSLVGQLSRKNQRVKR